MGLPIFPIRLLIQVHSHNQWLTQSFGDFDKFDPTRMLPEYVPDDQCFPFQFSQVNEFFALVGIFRQWLFSKYMTTSLQSHFGKWVMGVGIG